MFGCGKCILCRQVKASKRATRTLLELLANPDAIFVTLTYDEGHVPVVPEMQLIEVVEGPSKFARLRESGPLDAKELLSMNGSDPREKTLVQEPTGRSIRSLRKSDLQKFFKRLRKRLAKQNRKFRYEAVGEYGRLGNRPHYHVIMSAMTLFDTELINDAWGMGIVDVQPIETSHARYVGKHQLRPMYKSPESGVLKGREPEFTVGSRKPAWGIPGVIKLAQLYDDHRSAYRVAMEHFQDVVPFIRTSAVKKHLGKEFRTFIANPLDRYVKQHLRELLNLGAPVYWEGIYQLYGDREQLDREQLEHKAARLERDLRMSGIL